MSSVEGMFKAIESGSKHVVIRRFTLFYPEQKLKFVGDGYQFDPKEGVGIPGYRGRHILFHDKCTGCQLCSIMCEGIAEAIEMVKVDKELKQNKKGRMPQIDFGKCVFCGLCIDPSTPVLMNPSIKPIAEVKVGDKVLTHTGEYKRVTKVWNMKYTGYLYEIDVYGHPDPLICTEDHPILAVSRPYSLRKDRRLLKVYEPLEFYLPRDIKEGDYVAMSIVKKVVDDEYYKQEVELYKNGRVKDKMTLALEPDLFRLIGYYIAEGYCYGNREVNFAFASNERELIEDCKALLNRYFDGNVKEEYNGSNSIRVTLYSAKAERFFRQFGKGAENKKMVDFVFFAPPYKQVELVKGIWFGDGCKINQSRQVYMNIKTISHILAYQLQQVLARLGIVACVRKQDSKDRKRSYSINIFGKYAIRLADMFGLELKYSPEKHTSMFHITEDYVFYPIRRISRRYISDYRVMDVTVEEDHTFTPAGIITSNCVDACPFYALFMTDDYELSSYTKEHLIYTPDQLAVKPDYRGNFVLDIDELGATHTKEKVHTSEKE